MIWFKASGGKQIWSQINYLQLFHEWFENVIGKPAYSELKKKDNLLYICKLNRFIKVFQLSNYC